MGRVRIDAREDGFLPLNHSEVSESLKAVFHRASEVRLSDFLGSPSQFANQGLLALGQSREVVELELFKGIELFELVGSEVEFMF